MAQFHYRKMRDLRDLRAEINRLQACNRSLQEQVAAAPPGRRDSLFAQMFEQHAAVMLLIDPLARRIVDANFAAAEFYGYPRDVLRGMSVDRINAQPESEVAAQRQEAINGVRKHFIFEHRLASGAVRTLETHISTIVDNGRALFFSILHDITERNRADEQVRALAYLDTLTQLPNRRKLYERLSSAMAESRRSGHCFAFMLLDLDRFKAVNDAYGHAAGDALLVEVAHRIRTCMRDIDTLARFGGDEFVVVIDRMDPDWQAARRHAGEVAERIRICLSQPYRLAAADGPDKSQSTEFDCPASIGIVVALPDNDDENDIFKWADAAMYEAKTSGGNRFCFHDPGRAVRAELKNR